MFFLGSLYLEHILRFSVLPIGLAFIPVTLIIGVLSLKYAEPLITRFGARNTLPPGLVLIGFGLLLFTPAPVGGTSVRDCANGSSTESPLTSGYRPAFLIGAGPLVAGIMIAVAVLNARAQRVAEGAGPQGEPASST